MKNLCLVISAKSRKIILVQRKIPNRNIYKSNHNYDFATVMVQYAMQSYRNIVYLNEKIDSISTPFLDYE